MRQFFNLFKVIPQTGRTDTMSTMGEIPAGGFLQELALENVELFVRQISAPEEWASAIPFTSSTINANEAPYSERFLKDNTSYATTAISLYRLKNGSVIANDGVVIYDNKAVSDTVKHLPEWLSESAIQSHVLHHSVTLKKALQNELIQDNVFVGYTPSWRNYAQWMRVCLPKIVTWLNIRHEIGNPKLLLPNIPKEGFQQETLDILGICSDDVMVINNDSIVKWNYLYLLDEPDHFASSSYFLRAKNLLLSKAMDNFSREEGFASKIYIHRDSSSVRNVSNFAALQEILIQNDFQIISFERCRLLDQIKALANAEYIIAEHGAGVINIMFAKPVAVVLELFNTTCIQPAFWSVASICGHQYGYLVGSHVPSAAFPEPDWNADYEISPETLATSVKKMLTIDKRINKFLTISRAVDNSTRIEEEKMLIAKSFSEGRWLSSFLSGLDQSDMVILNKSEERVRNSPFIAQNIERHQSTFGKLFAEERFKNYRVGNFIGCKLTNITLIGSDGVILCGREIIYDTLDHVITWDKSSLIESFVSHASLVLKTSTRVINNDIEDPCVIGFSTSWQNYAHWIEQSVPKIFAYLELRKTQTSLKIVLPKFSRGSFQQQTLSLLGIDADDVINIDPDVMTPIRTAWVFSTPDIWSLSSVLQKTTLRLSEHVSNISEITVNGPERIYIHRGAGKRTVANFTAVKEILISFNFQIINFEDYPLDQQIKLMQGARFIVAEHGAGLVNLAFCCSQARVLELFGPATVQPAFWSLSSLYQLDYGFIVGHVEHDSVNAVWNSDFIIEIDDLIKGIFLLLKEDILVVGPNSSEELGKMLWIAREKAFPIFTPQFGLHALAPEQIEVGFKSVGQPMIFIENGDLESRLVIGNSCSIAAGCKIFLENCSEDFAAIVGLPLVKEVHELYQSNEAGICTVKIDSNVNIGAFVTILPGTEIGTGCIIKSNSCVMGKIPPFAILAGCPAKIIGFRTDAC